MSASPFGYQAPARDNFVLSDNDIQTNEIVECLILDNDYPASLKKDVDPSQLSFKKHGLSLRIAIMLRDRCYNFSNPFAKTPPSEKVFTKDDLGNLVAPKIQAFTNINIYPPPLIYSKYTRIVKGGLEDPVFRADGTIVPVIEDLLPSPFVEKNKDGMKANEIPEHLVTTYASLIKKESDRRKNWDTVNNLWEKQTEEQCCDILSDTAARSLLLCSYDDTKKKFIYHRPYIGMLFRARVKRNINQPKYFELEPFAWNKGSKRYEIYSTLNTSSEAVPAYIEHAFKLSELRDKEIAARAANRIIKEEYTADQGDAF